MAFINKVKRFFSDFRIKHRISLNDPMTENEVWHIYLSPANIFSAILALIIILTAIIVSIIAFTPVLDYLSGYQGNKTRNVLIENHLKLDSLENSLQKWDDYYNNLVRIMDGLPAYPSDDYINDSINDSIAYVNRSVEDSLLRNQLEGDGEYGLNRNNAGSGNTVTYTYFTPIQGIITERFDPLTENFGISITTLKDQPVISILDGTVIVSSWTPDHGNIIYISHPGNIISGYLINAYPVKKVGERVNAGDVIGMTSENDNENSAVIKFQLWINGTAVDPENYINF